MRSTVLLSSLLVGLSRGALGFAPSFFRHHAHPASVTVSSHSCALSSLHMAKRNKLSMAEKRKRRAKKLPPRPVTGKPVDFEKYKEKTNDDTDDADSIKDDNGDVPPTERAQQLLEAQRRSVDMLTHVRERVEALNVEDIQSSLDQKGYFVMDNFLQRDEMIDELQSEALALFHNDAMTVDLANLSSGEYICKIEGGEEQYGQCPRSVELVVSMTKHLAPALSFPGHDQLDPSACMATMRTYDRKAKQASLDLLVGKEEELPPKRPLGIVATEDKDARKISVFYYPTEGGGGVTFENEEAIPTKRDSLVLLKSGTCLHRREPWNAGDEPQVENASCIELHLIKHG